MIHDLLNWLYIHTGLGNPSGAYYAFWSGIEGDLTQLFILGGVLLLYRRHNCQVKGCYRIGRHPVEGTPYKTCHKHTTKADHYNLHAHHGRVHPEQHEMFNTTTE